MSAGDTEEAPKKRFKQGLITDCFLLQPTTQKCDERLDCDELFHVKCKEDPSLSKQVVAKEVEAGVVEISSDTEEYTLESAEMDESLGADLSEFKCTPQCAHVLPLLASSPSHHVLFKVGTTFNEPPKPLSDIYKDKWDSNFVRMPCSPESKYPIERSGGSPSLVSRWDLIRKTLMEKITCSHDLEKAIKSYNGRYKGRWDFSGLHRLFHEVLTPEETKEFFNQTLPRIIRLALQLPYLCTEPIPLLKKNSNHTISLSQLQISSLLANAFLCTFPRRNSNNSQSEFSNYPSINFNGLFSTNRNNPGRKLEKLKCLFHYFRRVTDKEPCGIVSFERKCLDSNSSPNWTKSTRQLCKLRVSPSGTIEDDGVGMLQMDFANQFLGGGVIRWGCVQEEIRFITCPDLIASALFTERLDIRDALIITGSERFSRSTGYADSFKFAGNFDDQTPFDSWGRRYTEVVAIDAKPFKFKQESQYEYQWLEREVNKAYCGFFAPGVPNSSLSAVATGNWGCGAFRGDPRLKSLLQIIAATEAGRDVVYFSFHDVDLSKDIFDIYVLLTVKKVSVGNLWGMLLRYHSTFKDGKPRQKLYDYIRNACSESYESCDGASGSMEEV